MIAFCIKKNSDGVKFDLQFFCVAGTAKINSKRRVSAK
jgi:hypothetical protein